MRNNEFKGTTKEYMDLEPLASDICDALFPNIFPPTEKFNIKGKIIRTLFAHNKNKI